MFMCTLHSDLSCPCFEISVQVLTWVGWKRLGWSTCEYGTKTMNKGLNYALGRSTNTKTTVADPVVRRQACMQQKVSGWEAGESGPDSSTEGRKGCVVEKGSAKTAIKGGDE